MDSGIPGFEATRIEVNGIALSVHQGGSGDPLILLHGFPQNHMCWARVAPDFANEFRVIIPDLRGYGDSEAPPDDASHTAYSKRQMALDVVAMADALDHPVIRVLGHDRGARVAYRLALDHPGKVSKLGLIEIVPTADFWAAWNAELALRAYHWTFLAQPAPLPEQLIGADPVGFLDHTLARWTKRGTLDDFTPDALESYRRQIREPDRIAAMCADYRAGATIDRALDEADRRAQRLIAAPLMLLFAEDGFPAHAGDPVALWKTWATDVTAQTCVSGHFAMEENPDAVISTFLPFFR